MHHLNFAISQIALEANIHTPRRIMTELWHHTITGSVRTRTMLPTGCLLD